MRSENFGELRKAEVRREPRKRTSGSVKLHSWVTLGQQGAEPDLRVYAVAHRCEVVVLTFASLGEGGISRLFCLDVLVPVQREPTSELEPLSCSLRVIIHMLLGLAGGCKIRIPRPVSLLCFALRCTVLRSRWCQSGVNVTLVFP